MFFQITDLKFTAIVGAYGKKLKNNYVENQICVGRYQQNGISL